MKNIDKLREVFHQLLLDRKIIFLVLAALLATVSIITRYTGVHSWSNYKIFTSYIPYAFTWVVLAWVITDKSILRKPWPYVTIFAMLFIDKIYWNLFYLFFPPSRYYTSSLPGDAFLVGSPHLVVPSVEWFNLQEKAHHLLIIVEFVIMVSVFIIFWYLSRPRDFTKLKTKLGFLKNKRMILIVIGSFFITMHLWLFHVVRYIGGIRFFEFLITNWYMIDWFNFLFHGLPLAIGIIVFAVVITNIEDKIKYLLYLIIFLIILLLYTPWFNQVYYIHSMVLNIVHIFCYFLLYMLLFLSTLLLAKTKYLE